MPARVGFFIYINLYRTEVQQVKKTIITLAAVGVFFVAVKAGTALMERR